MTSQNGHPIFPICATRIICPCSTGVVYCNKTLQPLWRDGDIVEVFTYKKDPSYGFGVAALVRKKGTSELRWIGVGLLSANAWLVLPDVNQ